MFFKIKLLYLTLYELFLLHSELYVNCLNIDTHDLERPGKSLCENHYQDVDCSNQVRSTLSHASCLMKYLNQNTTDCTDSEFVGEIDETEHSGTVNLIPYPWFDNGFIFPALNITFTQIHWERLRMRFVKVGLTSPQICREFELSADIDPSSVISFDCLWGNGATAGENYKFQYVLTNTDGRKFLYTYLLQIPKDTDVDNNAAPETCGMFMVMDQTAFPLLTLKLLVPPPRLHITSTTITLFYKQDLNSNIVKLQNWTIDLTNNREGSFVKVGPFDTDNSPGYYYFNASIYSDYCKNGCIESSTPLLQVAGMRHGIQVTIAIILLTTTGLGFMVFMLWKNKYKKILDDSEKPPTVLFVYESSYPSHIENIYKFKEFLEDNCYLIPKLDLIDIPKTNSMNPWKWYYNAFKEADYVLVFASPNENTERGIHQDNVYHNLHTYALKLLIVYLLNKHKFLIASIKLPGCSWDTLPQEALIINKQFSLPEELSRMFKFLNVPLVPNGSSLLVTVLQQARSPPQFSVSRPITSLKLPFDHADFDLDTEVREPLTVKGVTLDLDGQSTSEEEEEYAEVNLENGLSFAELNL